MLEHVDVVVSFGLVHVQPGQPEQPEQLAAVPAENAVDEEAKGYYVVKDWLAASPQTVGQLLAYHRSAIAVGLT